MVSFVNQPKAKLNLNNRGNFLSDNHKENSSLDFYGLSEESRIPFGPQPRSEANQHIYISNLAAQECNPDNFDSSL